MRVITPRFREFFFFYFFRIVCAQTRGFQSTEGRVDDSPSGARQRTENRLFGVEPDNNNIRCTRVYAYGPGRIFMNKNVPFSGNLSRERCKSKRANRRTSIICPFSFFFPPQNTQRVFEYSGRYFFYPIQTKISTVVCGFSTMKTIVHDNRLDDAYGYFFFRRPQTRIMNYGHSLLRVHRRSCSRGKNRRKNRRDIEFAVRGRANVLRSRQTPSSPLAAMTSARQKNTVRYAGCRRHVRFSSS